MNFQNIIAALSWFDVVISGGTVDYEYSDISLQTSKYMHIIHYLLFASNQLQDNIHHPYIHGTILSFIEAKTHIILDISNGNNDGFLEAFNRQKYNYRLVIGRAVMFVEKLIDVFKNVKTITIKTDLFHTISLFSIRSLLQYSSLNKLILELGAVSSLDKIKRTYANKISSDSKKKFNSIGYNLSDVFCYDTHAYIMYVV